MKRREFLSGAGCITLAALAGCAASGNGNDHSMTQGPAKELQSNGTEWATMLKPYFVERDIIRIIGRRRTIGPGPERDEIPGLWAENMKMLERIPNRVDDLFFGISIDFWHPERKSEAGEEGLRSYMVGAEVSSLVHLPYDLESE